MARLASGSYVKLDSRAVADLLRGPTGPVVRDLVVRATRVQERAKQLVGKRTQNLERSIVKRFVQEARGPAVLVGSDLPYARLHHEGTRPHLILPRNARVLRFPVAGGRIVFAASVNHPGTRPNRYLVDALQAARD